MVLIISQLYKDSHIKYIYDPIDDELNDIEFVKSRETLTMISENQMIGMSRVDFSCCNKDFSRQFHLNGVSTSSNKFIDKVDKFLLLKSQSKKRRDVNGRQCEL